MCGICGVLNLDGSPVDPDVVLRMNDMLIHRGPDQGAVFVDGNLGLGNRRLAILDTSDAGSLPMTDGELTIAFNGEIYNHQDIRRELEGRGVRDWHTTGDTETILKCYREYDGDINRVLNRLRGMFAFALWDGARRRLILARDRMGEKPLYFYRDNEKVVFASEIKAILAHPNTRRYSAFDSDSLMSKILAHYLCDGYLITYTPFLGIFALQPGVYIDVPLDSFTYDPLTFNKSYYTPPKPISDALITPAQEADWRDQTLDTLSDAVRGCLISDVPLGAFLSGGLDSSLIVALMRKHSNSTIKTFSIGFSGDASFDETAHAKRVAEHLGTEHTAFTVEPQTLDLLPKLVWHHDQPFADSSAIPTYLVSKLTRQQVTVALTGDGGDELFVGYERFYAAALAAKIQRTVPAFALRIAANVVERVPEGTGYYSLAKRARRFVRGTTVAIDDAYREWVSVFPAELVAELTNTSYRKPLFNTRMTTLEEIVYRNMTTYLPNDLLVKTDRSSMAASLEARAPFLDHRLVELAARIPMNLKLKGSTTKYILKQAARGLLPDDIIDRPKHGFGVPMGTWLRNDIRPAREILLSPEARGRGLLNMTVVERLLNEHAAGTRDHGGRLWSLLDARMVASAIHRSGDDCAAVVTNLTP